MIPARMEEAEKPVMKRKDRRNKADTAQAGSWPEPGRPGLPKRRRSRLYTPIPRMEMCRPLIATTWEIPAA